MKNTVRSGFLVFVLTIAFLPPGTLRAEKDNPRIRPVDAGEVQMDDVFWIPRLKANRMVTVPFLMKRIKDAGRLERFHSGTGLQGDRLHGRPDGDAEIYKILEAAVRSVRFHSDPGIQAEVDEWIGILARAQKPDGFLNSAGPAAKSDLPGAFVSAGSLFSAAAAHHAATGKRTLLDVAVRNAGWLERSLPALRKFSAADSGCIEIGLIDLFRATGDVKFLDSAEAVTALRANPAEGLGDARIFRSVVTSGLEAFGRRGRRTDGRDRFPEEPPADRISLAGGIFPDGSLNRPVSGREELPPTLPGIIGNILWNHHLFLLDGDVKRIDLLERALYNGFVSGVSTDGRRFLSSSPQFSDGKADMRKDPGDDPLPADIARFLSVIPGFIYAVKDDVLYINLYASNTTKTKINGEKVEIIQQTKHPWIGAIDLGFNPDKVSKFTVALRVPGWARGEVIRDGPYRFAKEEKAAPTVWLNMKRLDAPIEKGYIFIKRTWRKGDLIKISFPMPIRRVAADPSDPDSAGRIALQRGPMVFCAEGVDNEGAVLNLALPDDARLQSFYRPDLLNGTGIIVGQARRPGGKAPFMAVPYGVWGNRGPWEMIVWLPQTPPEARSGKGR